MVEYMHSITHGKLLGCFCCFYGFYRHVQWYNPDRPYSLQDMWLNILLKGCILYIHNTGKVILHPDLEGAPLLILTNESEW